jgi:membrane protease YdiL (CAAX protease family)
MGDNLVDFVETEWDYLALLLFELVFLAGTIAIVKGRKHSLASTFWGERAGDKAARGIILNILLGLGIGGLFFLIGWGIATLTEQVVTVTFGNQVLEDAQQGVVNLTPPTFSPVGIALAIAGQYVLVGSCEELFFRGALFRDLFTRRQRLGAVLSAGAFMIYHVFPGIVPWVTFAINWPYYFSLGLLFALLAWLRRFNLIAPIIAHGTYNTILFILTYLLVA